MKMGIILFLLVAIQLFNIRLYFPVMAGKMQYANFYCDAYKVNYSANNQTLTIWKLGKNRFV